MNKFKVGDRIRPKPDGCPTCKKYHDFGLLLPGDRVVEIDQQCSDYVGCGEHLYFRDKNLRYCVNACSVLPYNKTIVVIP